MEDHRLCGELLEVSSDIVVLAWVSSVVFYSNQRIKTHHEESKNGICRGNSVLTRKPTTAAWPQITEFNVWPASAGIRNMAKWGVSHMTNMNMDLQLIPTRVFSGSSTETQHPLKWRPGPWVVGRWTTKWRKMLSIKDPFPPVANEVAFH